tara:strand:- start:22937 stop:23809 length:873 start_codon:yes stop_codon:yes gene_type:complete
VTPVYFKQSNCLHTDEKGTYWHIDKQGRHSKFLGLESTKALDSGPYRVIGCPDNYRLITELHLRFNRQDNEAAVYVGSPLVGKGRSCTRDTLNCISVLDVQDNLSCRWHKLSGQGFTTFLLLQAWKESVLGDLVKTVYKTHCLSSHFDFIGVSRANALQLISQIVDPRWFINSNRPMRMQSLEAYFGLTPRLFNKAWKAGLEIKPNDTTVRAAFLMNVVGSLKDESCLRQASKRLDAENITRHSCKRLLNYVFRNWLEAAGLKGYFDPEKFFKTYDSRVDYYHRFGSKDA